MDYHQDQYRINVLMCQLENGLKNMVQELLMGFDCREMWMPEAEVKNWSDASHLLKPDVQRIMSVNQGFWHSVFLPPGSKHSLAAMAITAPGYSLAIPDEWMTTYRFWRDLDAMRVFMSDHEMEYQRRCWMIGITVVQTPEYLLGLEGGGMNVPPVLEAQADPQWTFLGYEVEDSVFFNGGLGRAWMEEYQRERRKLWADRLNQYYLFSSQEDAVECAAWHSKLNPGVGRLLVFGLYLIQEVP